MENEKSLRSIELVVTDCDYRAIREKAKQLAGGQRYRLEMELRMNETVRGFNLLAFSDGHDLDDYVLFDHTKKRIPVMVDANDPKATVMLSFCVATWDSLSRQFCPWDWFTATFESGRLTDV